MLNTLLNKQEQHKEGHLQSEVEIEQHHDIFIPTGDDDGDDGAVDHQG